MKLEGHFVAFCDLCTDWTSDYETVDGIGVVCAECHIDMESGAWDHAHGKTTTNEGESE